MNNPESLREFTNQLVRRGLPVEYSRRTAEEIGDHHRDLTEELQLAGMGETAAVATANERLGNPKSLVKKTVREFQRRHWCGRWPLLTFFIGPAALLFLGWTSTILFLAGLGKSLEALDTSPPDSSQQLSLAGLAVVHALVGWCVLILPAIVLFALSRLATRSGLSRYWIVLSALLLGLIAGAIRWGFQEQLNIEIATPNDDHPFLLSLPYWFFFYSPKAMFEWYVSSPQQIAQLTGPLMIAAFLIWRIESQQSRQVRLTT
jgi:hypothetical protein